MKKTHKVTPQAGAHASDATITSKETFEATVESVVVRSAADGSAITYATLRSDSKTLYAAWKNSYFARDIAVHRKYHFTGAIKRTSKLQYMADPIFSDVPVVSKYFDFSLLRPGEQQPRSGAYMTMLVLLVMAVPAVALTLVFNSAYMEQKLAQQTPQVSVTESAY